MHHRHISSCKWTLPQGDAALPDSDTSLPNLRGRHEQRESSSSMTHSCTSDQPGRPPQSTPEPCPTTGRIVLPALEPRDVAVPSSPRTVRRPRFFSSRTTLTAYKLSQVLHRDTSHHPQLVAVHTSHRPSHSSSSSREEQSTVDLLPQLVPSSIEPQVSVPPTLIAFL